MADDINKKIAQIEARLNKLFGTEKKYYEDQLKNLKANTAELENFERLFRDIVNATDEINDGLDSIAKSFRASVAELSKQNKELTNAKSALNSISKIASELVYENSQGPLIEGKTLDKLEKKAKLQFESLKIAIQSGKIQNEELTETKEALKDKERFYDLIQSIREEQQKIKKDSGIRLFTGLETLTDAIPGFSKFSSAFNDASKAAQETAMYNQKIFGSTKGLTKEEIKQLEAGKKINKELADRLGLKTKGGRLLKKDKEQIEAIRASASSAMSPMMAGIKSLGPALSKALGPLVIIYELFKAFKSVDKTTGSIAKKMNMSYSSALTMKKELTAAANASGDLFVTSKGMAESLVAINAELGTSVMLNKENLATFTTLRERAGLTNDELMGMQSLVNATGGDLKKMTKEFLGHASITAKNNKVILNEKQLMTEISRVSAATTLSLGKQPKELAKAVTTAKALGMEMAKIEGIMDSLLNFEDSISAEMEAELITGKQINLERARLAAINNDISTVVEEIASQFGSAADFSNMNRIQQESIAKAVGMNREELAKTLFLQEQMVNVSKEEAKLREQKINKLLNDGLSIEQAAEQVGKEKFEDLKNQASMQDRFNASVEKLREIFVNIAEITMPFFNGLANVVGWLAESKTLLYSILGAYTGIKVTQTAIVALQRKESILRLLNIKRAATLSALNAISNPVKAIAGLAAAAVVGAAAGALISKAGDINSPAKGKTVVSTKEGGLFELSKNDDLVAAPGLSQTLSNTSNQSSSTVSVNMEPLIKEVKMMKEILTQILQKEGTITLNGTKMGTAMAVGTYKIQ
jgi:hypothetical protein